MSIFGPNKREVQSPPHQGIGAGDVVPIKPMPIPVPTHPVAACRAMSATPPVPATLHDLKAMLDEMRAERDAFGASRRNTSPCPSHRSPPGGGGGGYVETRSQRRHHVIVVRCM